MDLPRLKIGYDIENKMSVYIQDRYTHILLTGKSGTGKSTSIANWWEQDYFYGFAKILIDPSGFLARDCYSIGGGRYCSQDHPISINPMQSPYSDSQISDIIAEAINQVVCITTPNQSFTVKMRGILDKAVKECLKNNRRSLLNVRDYISNLKGDGETRDGILARLNFILNDEKMERILCGNNSVEWGELIKKRQTFILDCFGMSKEKMIFAGNIITQGIKNYFRYDKPNEYLPLSIYIDECHNFINPNLFDILKEGRKYKLSCVLATQDFATIDEKMTRTMLNVGNVVSYKVGYREAQHIAKELFMTPQELQSLEKYHVAYMTPKESGIAKAPRPPLIIEKELPIMEVPQRKASPSWFMLESFSPA